LNSVVHSASSAPFAVVRSATAASGYPVRRERRDRGLERRLAAQLQTDRLLRRVAGLVDQRVVAKIGTERRLLVGLLDQLQAEDMLRKIDRRRQVARAEADVTQLLDFDHCWVSFPVGVL